MDTSFHTVSNSLVTFMPPFDATMWLNKINYKTKQYPKKTYCVQ